MSLYNYSVANTNNTQSRTGNRCLSGHRDRVESTPPGAERSGERRGDRLTGRHRGGHRAAGGLSALKPRATLGRAASLLLILSMNVQSCSSPGLGTVRGVGGGNSERQETPLPVLREDRVQWGDTHLLASTVRGNTGTRQTVLGPWDRASPPP